MKMVEETPEGGRLNMKGRTLVVSGSPIPINKSIRIQKGKLKRGKPAVTTIREAFSAGAKAMIVESTEGFKVGDWTLVVSSPEYKDNSGIQIGSITSIEGNKITTYQPHPKGMPAGSQLIHAFPMLRLKKGESIKFVEIEFDGNMEENNYTIDWRYNSTMTLSKGMMANRCIFRNMPGENVFLLEGSVVKHSEGYNLNGTFTHQSNGTNPILKTYIYGNYVDGVCLVNNGHNEGAIGFSAKSQLLVAFDNVMKNGGRACYGQQELDDHSNIVFNNYWENFERKVGNIVRNHPDPLDTSRDVFVNVGE